MDYKTLKTGTKVEMEVLSNKIITWIKGTVYENENEPFFTKRVKLQNGMDEPVLEHRMDRLRECK